MNEDRKAPVGFIGNVPGAPMMDKGWMTPPEILWPARRYWGGRIPFDTCTTAGNPTDAAEFWTPETDGLAQTWPERCWMNPPYGSSMKPWLLKAVEESRRGSEVIALVSAARWEQGWMQEVLQAVDVICFVRGRVAFIRPSTGDRVGGNTYASMILGLSLRDRVRWVESFSKIGCCLGVMGLSGPPPATAYSWWRGFTPELFTGRERERDPTVGCEVWRGFPGAGKKRSSR